jgi:hypothetical protein
VSWYLNSMACKRARVHPTHNNINKNRAVAVYQSCASTQNTLIVSLGTEFAQTLAPICFLRRELASMLSLKVATSAWIFGSISAARPAPFATGTDPRNLFAGNIMIDSGYLDQPYCVISSSAAHDGEWMCVVTQDGQHEGGSGEHLLAIRSADEGVTWSDPVVLEPGTTLTNAYSAVVQEPSSGRVFCVYNMNVHNVSKLPSGKSTTRTDELGVFRMRYTDDNGRTWSDPMQLPLPITAIDLNNTWSGKVQIFWNVDVFHTWPVSGQTHAAAGFFFTKIGIYPQSPPEEDFVMWSPDLLTPGADPANATWHLSPNSTDPGAGAAGWRGILPPNGNPTISEEPHLLPMRNGGFYMEARTTQGLMAAAATASSDVGSGWPSRASFARYWLPTPSGADDTTTAHVAAAASVAGWGEAVKAAAGNASSLGLPSTGLVKQPRGPTMMKRLTVRLSDGSSSDVIAMLFYSNSNTGFDDSRNPYFLTVGTEVPVPGTSPARYDVVWAQPEVVLYDRLSPEDRPGYPDMTVRRSDGAIVITQTNKTVARANAIPLSVVTGLVQQRSLRVSVSSGVVASWSGKAPSKQPIAAPGLVRFAPYNASAMPGDGLSVQLWLEDHAMAKAGDVILSNAAALVAADRLGGAGSPEKAAVALGAGEGMSVTVGSSAGELLLSITGPQGGSMSYAMDSLCAGRLGQTGTHAAAVVLDSAARLATWVVDGVACDGGSEATNGWQWFNQDPTEDPVSVGGTSTLATAPSYSGSLVGGAVYNAALLVSELVGNYRAGPPQSA